MAETRKPVPRFAAFLSYSRDDRTLCDRVHRGLETLGRAFFRLRARRIFRDTEHLGAAGSVSGVLADAMEGSGYFVLLASPRAAASPWVAFEADSWLGDTGVTARNFLILLCDGDIVWDAVDGDFDWTRTTALPRVLSRRFAAEPIYSDIRHVVAGGRHLTLGNPQFRERLAEIVAPLDGRNKEDVVGRHLALRRQIGMVVVGLLIFFALLSGAFLNRANEVQRQQAVDAARQQLSRSADIVTADGDPDHWSGALRAALRDAQSAVSELLARLPRLTQADETYIRAALAGLPGSVARVPFEGAHGGFVSSDGRRVVIEVDGDDDFRVWDIGAQREIARVPQTHVFSRDLLAFAWNEDENHIAISAAGVRRIAASSTEKPLVPLAIISDGGLVYAERDYRAKENALYLVPRGSELPIRLCDANTDAVARFSPDGVRVAVVCRHTVRVWDVQRRTLEAKFEIPPGQPVGLSFNADGTRLALGTTQRVLLWSLGSEPRLLATRVLIGDDEDDDFIEGISLDSPGHRVAVNIDYEAVFCFDPLSGKTIWPQLAAWQFEERGRHTPDVLSPASAYRFVSNGFALFDTCTGTRLARVIVESEVEGAVHNEVARQLAVVSGTKDLFLVNLRPASVYAEDAKPGEVRAVLAATTAPVQALATAERLWVWDVERGSQLLEQLGAFAAKGLALSSDGETLAAVMDTTLTAWRCLRGVACEGGTAAGRAPVRISVSADATVDVTSDYALITEGDAIRLLRITDDGFRTVALPAEGRSSWLQTDARGRSRLLLSDADGSHLSTSELTGDSAAPLRPLAAGNAGDFEPSDLFIRMPSTDRLIVFRKDRLLTIGSDGSVKAVQVPAREYPSFAASNDSRFVAIATNPINVVPELLDADTVDIIDVEAGRIAGKIALQTHVAVMRFGHTGDLAVAANAVAQGEAGFRLKVFDRRDWKAVVDAQMPSRAECLAFSPDDALIAVGQRDSTTSVVDRAGARVLNAPTRGRVVFCDFFDNGTRLSTIGSRTDLTTLQVTPASRAALAERLMQLSPFIP